MPRRFIVEVPGVPSTPFPISNAVKRCSGLPECTRATERPYLGLWIDKQNGETTDTARMRCDIGMHTDTLVPLVLKTGKISGAVE